MRSPLLVVTCILALAAACGGKTSGVAGGGSGSSSGSASSSGGSGSGGSSSGDDTSSSSGSSSGGVGCEPLPGCNSSTECPEPNGCGACYCESGSWECTGCGDDVTDASIPDSTTSCPFPAPDPDTLCGPDGLVCNYASSGGCGESCDCLNGSWSCEFPPCPPPECPGLPPTPDTACFAIGEDCSYGDSSGCSEEECDCDPSGIWSCGFSTCVDSGPPDTGPPDAGGCPQFLPGDGASCNDQGDICSYFEGCETNCLCTDTGWVCASQEGC